MIDGVSVRIMGDEQNNSEAGVLFEQETQEWSRPRKERATRFSAMETGCLGGNEMEDCICPSCNARYRVSAFYLEVMVSDCVDPSQVYKVVADVVEQTTVTVPVSGGIGLDYCGYYWDSQPGCRQVVLMASMEADCVAEKLRSALVLELASLQCEAAPDIVVDTAGFGPRGKETSLSTWMVWYGVCVHKAWPDLLPAKAQRLGDPWNVVQRLDVDDTCLNLYTLTSDDEWTPNGSCASLEKDFNDLRVEGEENFYDCDEVAGWDPCEVE